MSKEILEKIKSRGYWRIIFRPVNFLSSRIKDLPRCKELIEKNSVELRGWDYPHFPRRKGNDTDLIPGNDYYEGWVDWQNHKELWRFYQSGQFIHYLGLREDWFQESFWSDERLRHIEPGSILSVIGTVYQLTEIFEFLLRLTQERIYDDGIEVAITLYKTKGRKLEILDPGRTPLFMEYKASVDNIEFRKMLSKMEILENSKDIAFDAIIHLFHRFGWDNPPVDVIKSDQQRLIERRI